MKGQFGQTIRTGPIPRWIDIALLLLPAIAWAVSIQARPWIMKLHCARQPTNCRSDQVLTWDRFSLGYESSTADQISNWTQTFAGIAAFGTPLAWGTTAAFLGRVAPSTALALAGTDLTLVGQAVSWNGLIKEVTHWIVQRPRPFVYSDPMKYGKEPAHYTSFYSGHTSFAAAAGVALLLVLLGRGIRGVRLTGATIFVVGVTAATGLCRVMAGRHFLSDVLVAMLAGGLIALLVARLRRICADLL